MELYKHYFIIILDALLVISELSKYEKDSKTEKYITEKVETLTNKIMSILRQYKVKDRKIIFMQELDPSILDI